ncbi:hypothetical protein Daus18300_004179 [Diaporthe australafricana]|uniref:Uncharacterized protein n=1 Tax=Diaporthe australafricana TaxID=127596 RepID=A0ABR3XBH1_9PEZI
MPSWVPDFSDATGPHSLTGMGMLLPGEASSLTEFCASSGAVTKPRFSEDGTMEQLGHYIGDVDELSTSAAPRRDLFEIHRLRMTSQIESSRLHNGEIYQDNLRMINMKTSWDVMARKLEAKSRGHYVQTGESMDEAVTRTCLLGETDEILENMRPFYKNDQFEVKIWRLLTFGQGCSSELIGVAVLAVMILGLRAAEPLLRRYGYGPFSLNRGEYYARRQLSAEREMFCGTNNMTKEVLIGLAPRWARPGDKIFILRGGKVPVILRGAKVDGLYQFIGEAYVHGAMYGHMFNLNRCEKLLIH